METFELKEYKKTEQDGAAGIYDFFLGAIGGMLGHILGTAIIDVAHHIWTAFKNSKAENSDTDCCRYSLVIKDGNKYPIVIDIFQNSKFRTRNRIEEDDIIFAIQKGVQQYKLNPDKEIFVSLRNISSHTSNSAIQLHVTCYDQDLEGLGSLFSMEIETKGSSVKLDFSGR